VGDPIQPADPGEKPDRATTLRYAALQIPGLLLASVFSWLAIDWFDVPRWAAGLAILLWIIKDAVMFPFVWRAYSVRTDGGLHDVRGRIGTVEEALAPHGRVRVGSEHWRATAAPDAGSIAEGTRVRVVALDGLKITVVPEPHDATPSA
jgi:membrane-bound serine protease (ClpP class)